MNITPFERLRFHVESTTSKGVIYTVDLGSYRRRGICNGRCDCPDFEIRKYPEMKRGIRAEIEGGEKFIPSDKTRCIHIIAVRRGPATETMLDLLVTEFRKQYNDYHLEEAN